MNEEFIPEKNSFQALFYHIVCPYLEWKRFIFSFLGFLLLFFSPTFLLLTFSLFAYQILRLFFQKIIFLYSPPGGRGYFWKKINFCLGILLFLCLNVKVSSFACSLCNSVLSTYISSNFFANEFCTE